MNPENSDGEDVWMGTGIWGNRAKMEFGKLRKPKRIDTATILSIASIIVTVTSLAFAVYIYIGSKAVREPELYIEPIRIEIVNSGRVSLAPIKVIKKKDNREITSDLTAMTFRFHNLGRKSIKREDILRDIKITLDDPNAEIVDLRLTNVSRDIIDFRIIYEPEKSLRSFIIDFLILEQEDFGECVLIYEGNPKCMLIASGEIEGVKEIESNIKSIEDVKFWILANQVFYIALGILIFLLLIVLKKRVQEKKQDLTGDVK